MSEPPWASSESTEKIIPALVAALHQVTDIAKGRTAKVPTKGGGSYTYTYADLGDVLDEMRPHLAANGLAVSQIAAERGTVRTVFLHSSGEWIAYPALFVPTGQDTPQALGSAVTYARRYQLLAALGIATEDDDGNRAAQRPDTPARPEPERTYSKRATTAYDELRALEEPARHELRTWAGDRSLSLASLDSDGEWLLLVEQWLDQRKADDHA